MKHWKKIAICIVLCFVVPVAGIAVWQQENLRALYSFITKDGANIEQELETQRQEQQSKLEEEYQVAVKPPSSQHNNDLINGVVTPEDVKGELGITEKLEDKEPEETVKPVVKPEQKPVQQEEKTEQPEIEPEEEPVKPEELPKEPEMTEEERIAKINDLVERCTAELYACEVDLMARLGEMKQAAVAEWTALAPEERTNERKLKIGFAGLDQCYELEVEINAQVKAILANYRTPLEDLNADTAVLDDLWIYYCEKKENTKAYYMDKYLD